jgi:predicted thioesterase
MKTPINEVKGEALSIVNSTNTAVAAQSGTLQVFGTPFMIALMEKATCVAIADHLEDGETTVGTNVEISHVKASRVGAVITATATLDDIDGRKLTFSVVAREEDGAKIGEGKIERFVVLSDKFMKKVETK